MVYLILIYHKVLTYQFFIAKFYVSDTVVNISSHKLNQVQLSLLSKGIISVQHLVNLIKVTCGEICRIYLQSQA